MLAYFLLRGKQNPSRRLSVCNQAQKNLVIHNKKTQNKMVCKRLYFWCAPVYIILYNRGVFGIVESFLAKSAVISRMDYFCRYCGATVCVNSIWVDEIFCAIKVWNRYTNVSLLYRLYICLRHLHCG